MSEEVRVGDVIAGKYRVESVLGRGGMGYVVAARHAILGPCAIKLLHPAFANHAEVVARFVREAQAAQRIQSEHVVRVSDVGVIETTSTPFMVMEFLQGEDLAATLKSRGRLSLEDAVAYLLQACEALAEAHAEGIVHRDLKPSNLFLTTRRDGTPFVKLLDFGISKVSSTTGEGTSNLTRTSGVMGTVLYMSPEQLQRPKEVDARSDIWALGVILFELLTGRVPFLGDDMPNTVVKVMLEEPPSLRSMRDDLPPALEAVVARCLAKNREHRFPHVADFASALAPFATRHALASIERISGVAVASGQRLSGAPPIEVVRLDAQPISPSALASGQMPVIERPAAPPWPTSQTTGSSAVTSRTAPPPSEETTTAGVPRSSSKKLPIALGVGVLAILGVLGGVAATRGAERSPAAASGIMEAQAPAKAVVMPARRDETTSTPATSAQPSASTSASAAASVASASASPAKTPTRTPPTTATSKPPAAATASATKSAVTRPTANGAYDE